MSHKTLAMIAVVMVVVFGTITVVYPMLFNPDTSNSPVAAPPPAPVVAP